MAKLFLFDVDGTLVLSGGAGMRSMDLAFERVFGVKGALGGVALAGRTDPAILAEAIARAGVTARDGQAARFREVYCGILGEELARPPKAGSDDPSRPRQFNGVFPGVRETLDALAARDDAWLALLTGNYRCGAALKLGRFGLWEYFAGGAFGDDAVERWELVGIAVARARAAGCPAVPSSDVWVVGDTPLDVAAARRAGVRSLGVATGGYAAAALEAAGADLALARLEPELMP
jgi:phosphoglycolate phosphatase